MNDTQPPSLVARLGAYALLGGAIGAVVVTFVAEPFTLGSVAQGFGGGAIAGAIAGFIRTRSGLDK